MRNISISSSLLQDLDLSSASLSGTFPSFIQNLSSIRSLHLGDNQLSSVPLWLGNLLDLKELYLADNLFTGPFPSVIQNLSSIEYIDLSGNQFKSSLPSWIASKKLKYLNMAQNFFDGPFPQFIQNSSSLTFIDLSSNQFSLSIPSWLADKRDLEYVDLTSNKFDGVDGGIMKTLGRLCSLRSLDFSYNSFQEKVSETHDNISRCVKYDLTHLSLSNNNISGHLPIIQSFSSLQYLDLSQNNLETIPSFLWSFSSLYHLNLSYNHLSTVVHQESLANLSRLSELDISSNSFVLDVSPDWMPPFQLQTLIMSSCKLNGPFPEWILSQRNIWELDLSNTGISGPLPHNIGRRMSSLGDLRLANNDINGSIPKSLCELVDFFLLDMENNLLSGVIPDCWINSNLQVVVLSSNRLSGPIPKSIGNNTLFEMMSLSNNSLEGDLSPLLYAGGYMRVFDVGMNNLHGEISHLNEEQFSVLEILILGENRFEGIIPPELCSIQAFQIIDLAKNDLVGPIPQCFGHFGGMSFAGFFFSHTHGIPYIDPQHESQEWSATELLKGEERLYTSVLHLLVNMDLSCNNLEGVIPPNITSLSLLIGLNLSHNHLTGPIPKEIGNMTALESLDLSSNNLSGSIPNSISSLNSLSSMNLSFNNLHGQIPTGSQLQTLDDPSIYWGNPGLCGDPLPKKCSGDGITQPPTGVVNSEEEEDKHERIWFYVVIMLGFVSGFWGVIGILIVKRGWRHAYFGLAEEIGDWLYVRVALWIARSKGKGECNTSM